MVKEKDRIKHFIRYNLKNTKNLTLKQELMLKDIMSLVNETEVISIETVIELVLKHKTISQSYIGVKYFNFIQRNKLHNLVTIKLLDSLEGNDDDYSNVLKFTLKNKMIPLPKDDCLDENKLHIMYLTLSKKEQTSIKVFTDRYKEKIIEFVKNWIILHNRLPKSLNANVTKTDEITTEMAVRRFTHSYIKEIKIQLPNFDFKEGTVLAKSKEKNMDVFRQFIKDNNRLPYNHPQLQANYFIFKKKYPNLHKQLLDEFPNIEEKTLLYKNRNKQYKLNEVLEFIEKHKRIPLREATEERPLLDYIIRSRNKKNGYFIRNKLEILGINFIIKKKEKY